MIKEFPLEFGFQCFDCSNTIVLHVLMIKKDKPETMTCSKCKSKYRVTLRVKSYEQLERPYLEVEDTH
jgi:transcription elongation factor Elf1